MTLLKKILKFKTGIDLAKNFRDTWESKEKKFSDDRFLKTFHQVDNIIDFAFRAAFTYWEIIAISQTALQDGKYDKAILELAPAEIGKVGSTFINKGGKLSS